MNSALQVLGTTFRPTDPSDQSDPALIPHEAKHTRPVSEDEKPLAVLPYFGHMPEIRCSFIRTHKKFETEWKLRVNFNFTTSWGNKSEQIHFDHRIVPSSNRGCGCLGRAAHFKNERLS